MGFWSPTSACWRGPARTPSTPTGRPTNAAPRYSSAWGSSTGRRAWWGATRPGRSRRRSRSPATPSIRPPPTHSWTRCGTRPTPPRRPLLLQAAEVHLGHLLLRLGHLVVRRLLEVERRGVEVGREALDQDVVGLDLLVVAHARPRQTVLGPRQLVH